MPRCRGAASRGQVLLLRLLLVCALVATARQEGEFTWENLPAGEHVAFTKCNFKAPAFASRSACQSALGLYSEPFMDTLLGEREGYVFIWEGRE